LLLAGRGKISLPTGSSLIELESDMRLGNQRESSNVEDRRGVRFGRAGGIGIGTSCWR